MVYKILRAKIEARIYELRSAYGRRLTQCTSTNVYVQHARGKLEAYQELLIDLAEVEDQLESEKA